MGGQPHFVGSVRACYLQKNYIWQESTRPTLGGAKGLPAPPTAYGRNVKFFKQKKISIDVRKLDANNATKCGNQSIFWQ